MKQIIALALLGLATTILGCGGTASTPPAITAAPTEQSTAAKPQPTDPAVAEIKNSFTDEKMLLSFPPTLGHLSFAGYEEFEAPGLGYSVRYNNTDNMKVDVYVYDKGLLTIPEGTSDPVIAKELAGSDSTIRYYEQQRTYLNVKELGRGIYPENPGPTDIAYLFSRYQYHQAPRKGVTFTGERISETFIRGYRDHFVKVRVSYAETSAAQATAERDALLQHLSNSMKTQNAN